MSKLSEVDALEIKEAIPPGVKSIFRAAAQNDVGALREALRYYDVNDRDNKGFVALHHAAQTRAHEVIRILIGTAGIDATIVDPNGRTAVEIAFDHWGNLAYGLMQELMPRCHPSLFDGDPQPTEAPRTELVTPLKRHRRRE